jgi:ATP-binding cassette subfamily F protein uup
MKDFLFRPEQARTPVGALSGGERGRLMLACALAKPSSLLVLDEPTNDLDLETLDILQDMLSTYEGTVLLVSHDRDFLDRVATSVVATQGDGEWIEYAGGYSDMLAQRNLQPLTTEPVVAPAVSAKGSGAPRSAAKKLSYKDQYALDRLPEEMAQLESRIVELREKLQDSTLYGRDPARFEHYTAALQTAEAALATCEERWLELEMKREALQAD